MFSRFIKNKILSVLVLISSFSYGAQSKNTESDEVHPQSQERAKALSSTDKIYVNNMPFYIPTEEPSLEEKKKKAVLMYWEHLDPKTGKITVIKYPDTLKVKEEEPTEVYDDSDLTPWPWFKQNKSVSAPKTQPTEVTPKPISMTHSVTQIKSVEIQTSEPDPLEKILERLEAEERETQQETDTKNVTSNITTSCKTLIPSQTNSLPQVNHVCEQNIHEIAELMALLEEDSTPQKNLIIQSPKVEIPKAQETNTLQIISPQSEDSTVITPQKNKSSLDEVSELLKELEKEDVSVQQFSHIPHHSPIKGGIALSALGGSAVLGISKLRRRKKKSSTKQTQLNLISTEQISKDQTEKRNELANKLKAIRTIEDIKKCRQLLSKQLRLARANNDEHTIQSILNTRKELAQKRRQACLCITNPYTAHIKEERRLLTKKMTIARKKKDLQTMSQITQRREHLKEKVKSLNAYIREFNYTQKRSSFLKANTIKLILSHQNQKS